MKLENYISELLYKYDCIIVPGLGGFIANYKSATIRPVQNTFSPPSKSISFNKNLNKNDGLLLNFVAQKEGISFDAATKKIEDHVVKINRSLKLKTPVKLEGIGSLFLDTENRIQFEPQNTTNYLLESYGLSVFQKQPINRTISKEKITKQYKDRAMPLPIVNGKKGVNPKWRAAAIIIPLAFLAAWIPSQYNLNDDLNYATLNPFKPEKKVVYSPANQKAVFNDLPKSKLKEEINSASGDTYFLEVIFDKNTSPIIVRLKDNPIAEPDNTAVASSTKKLQYHVVGGCFSTKSNANQMVRKLKRKGFNASVVGKRKGLWTVSYNSFITKKEAVNFLPEARSNNSKAWILKEFF